MRGLNQRVLNGQFQRPLPHSEVKAIAKSFATWTWKQITPQGLRELIERTHSPEKQRERGKRATNQAEFAHLGGKD
nr:primase C-terminal domain-containing protein [Acidithiobacillus caldus]